MTALLSLLESIQQYSQKLHDCLIQEKQALDASQYEHLCELASEKQTLVDQLQALDKQRVSNSPDADFNSFIANSDDPTLIRQWTHTQKIIRLCQQQNEVNGRLLYKRNKLNQETIAILSGRDKQTSQTYDEKGGQINSNSLLDGIKA